MANRGREPAQQPERHLLLGRRLAGLVAEQREPILDILVAGRHEELENRSGAFPVGDQPQTTFLFALRGVPAVETTLVDGVARPSSVPDTA